MSINSNEKALRRAKRKAPKKLKSAQHEQLPVWQVPIVLDRDTDNIIGVVTLDPNKVPAGTDWGLQPGEKEGKIILFSTVHKGTRSKLVQ